MVRHQRPREAAELELADQPIETVEECLAVCIVGEDHTPLDAANHHMMRYAGGVGSGSTSHLALRGTEAAGVL